MKLGHTPNRHYTHTICVSLILDGNTRTLLASLLLLLEDTQYGELNRWEFTWPTLTHNRSLSIFHYVCLVTSSSFFSLWRFPNAIYQLDIFALNHTIKYFLSMMSIRTNEIQWLPCAGINSNHSLCTK